MSQAIDFFFIIPKRNTFDKQFDNILQLLLGILLLMCINGRLDNQVVQSVENKAPSLYVTTGNLLLHFVTFDKYILPLTAIPMESFPLNIYSHSCVVA